MSQYQSLFGYSGVEIRFTNGALEEICKKAFDRGGGARGLRGIMVSQGSTRQFLLLTVDGRSHYYWSLCMKSRE